MLKDERKQIKAIENDYQQMPGFTDFPYTHGDVIEQRRLEMRQQMSKELNQVLEAQAKQFQEGNIDAIEIKVDSKQTKYSPANASKIPLAN